MELSLVAYGEPDATAPDRRNPADDTVRLFDELARPLRAYLIGSGAAPQGADDAVQETFLRFCRHLRADGDVLQQPRLDLSSRAQFPPRRTTSHAPQELGRHPTCH